MGAAVVFMFFCIGNTAFASMEEAKRLFLRNHSLSFFFTGERCFNLAASSPDDSLEWVGHGKADIFLTAGMRGYIGPQYRFGLGTEFVFAMNGIDWSFDLDEGLFPPSSNDTYSVTPIVWEVGFHYRVPLRVPLISGILMNFGAGWLLSFDGLGRYGGRIYDGGDKSAFPTGFSAKFDIEMFLTYGVSFNVGMRYRMWYTGLGSQRYSLSTMYAGFSFWL
jgi:hypothetical protein